MKIRQLLSIIFVIVLEQFSKSSLYYCKSTEMKKQDYSNHIRYYPPHHFVFYPVVLALIGVSVSFIFRYPDQKLEWAAITIAFVLICWVAFMMRQHYALMVQNRVVRLEMRLRYYQLTQQRFEMIESRLTFSQIAALRFASDDELVALIKKTLEEQLSADKIKRLIVNWMPDTMRV